MKQLYNLPRLENKEICLLPLHREHFNELVTLAKDKRIWQFYVFDGTNEQRFIQTLEAALIEKANGTHLPFVIVNKVTGKLMGCTRYLDIQIEHRKLEIGWTWLHPDFWASSVNKSCKNLLLSYAFEVLKVVRVQFKTDETNSRSRKAIEKIGAKFEGVLRNDMIRDDGTQRHSAYYSILDIEWQTVKESVFEIK